MKRIFSYKPNKTNNHDREIDRDKIAFGKAFSHIASWLRTNCDSARTDPDSHLAKICSGKQSALTVTTIKRWKKGESLPQWNKWLAAKEGLLKAKLPHDMIQTIDEILAREQQPVLSAEYINFDENLDTRPISYSSNTPFLKLCFVNVEVPIECQTRHDFKVVGEIRVDSMPDIVDKHNVTVSLKRAVVLPITEGCRLKPGTLYRPRAGDKELKGASQIIFQANQLGPSQVLEGNLLPDGVLGRFNSNNRSLDETLTVDVQLQVEDPGDLLVCLRECSTA